MQICKFKAGIITSIFLFSSVLLYNVLDVAAHSGAKGVVKMRMDTMKSIGAQMKKMSAIVKDPSMFDAKLVSSTAKELTQHAAKIPDLFPKGTNQKPSEAKNEIWSDWDKFLAISNELKQSAAELQQANAETFKPTFLKAAKTCTTCHQVFRKKNN